MDSWKRSKRSALDHSDTRLHVSQFDDKAKSLAKRDKEGSNVHNSQHDSDLTAKPLRHCRKESDKRLSQFFQDQDEHDFEEDYQQSPKEKASKKKKCFGGIRTSYKHPTFPVLDVDTEAVPEIEMRRLANLKRNAEIMQSLGIESAAKSVQASLKILPKKKPVRNHEDADEDWDVRNRPSDSSGDEAESRKRKRKKNEVRACRASNQNTPPSPKLGPDLEGRRLRVSIYTEDVGGMAWHEGEVLRHRRRRGRDEHLVRWETEGAEDEWLFLPEEKFELIDTAMDHDMASDQCDEEKDEASLRPGDCVAVMCDSGNSGRQKLSYARLIDRRSGKPGGGSVVWTAHWFYGPEDLPKEVLQSKAGKQLDSRKELLFSMHEEELEEEAVDGRVEVIFSAASFRTVTKDQKLCRFIYDPAHQSIHRLSEKNFVPCLARILRQLLGGPAAVATASASDVTCIGDVPLSDESDEGSGAEDADGDEARALGESDEEALDADGGCECDSGQGVPELAAAGEDMEGYLCAAGGYFAALAGSRTSQLPATSWEEVGLADPAAVAAAMRRPPPAEELAASKALTARRRAMFGRWKRELQAGFAVVLYGVGSKRGLLREFAELTLTDGPVVEVAGYLPALRIRQVQFITNSIREARVRAGLDTPEDAGDASLPSCLGAIDEGEDADPHALESSDIADTEAADHVPEEDVPTWTIEPRQTRSAAAFAGHGAGGMGGTRAGSAGWRRSAPLSLYIVVHNLEGPGLRRDGAWEALVALASAPGVRLAGSVDHVNSGLLWSPAARAAMNPAWHDASTFAPHADELAHAAASGGDAGAGGAGVSAAAGGRDQVRAALAVLRSLNANAKGIFLLLITQQLDGDSEDAPSAGASGEGGAAVGMPFATLYERCREGFLAATELALRSHLAELRDHRLLRDRRGPAGCPLLYVPLPAPALAALRDTLRAELRPARAV